MENRCPIGTASAKNYVYDEFEASGSHDMKAAGKKKLVLKQPPSWSSTSKHSRFLHLLTKNHPNSTFLWIIHTEL